MRILDQDNDKSVNAIIIYFTKSEALEMKDSLEQLLADPVGRHEHISSQNYTKEVTVCIYDTDNLDRFDDRSKRLIAEDT